MNLIETFLPVNEIPLYGMTLELRKTDFKYLKRTQLRVETCSTNKLLNKI
jgi:hypothetical protein